MNALPVAIVPHPHVRVDAAVMNGSPYVVGSRVLVRRIYAFYQAGASFEALSKRYPQLRMGKILDALSFAHDNEETIKADIAHAEAFLLKARST